MEKQGTVPCFGRPQIIGYCPCSWTEDMFDLFDNFLDSLIDVYICNSAGICAILAAIFLSIIEGIITHFYLRKKAQLAETQRFIHFWLFGWWFSLPPCALGGGWPLSCGAFRSSDLSSLKSACMHWKCIICMVLNPIQQWILTLKKCTRAYIYASGWFIFVSP